MHILRGFRYQSNVEGATVKRGEKKMRCFWVSHHTYQLVQAALNVMFIIFHGSMFLLHSLYHQIREECFISWPHPRPLVRRDDLHDSKVKHRGHKTLGDGDRLSVV